MEKRKHLPRFKRINRSGLAFRLQERDLEIIKLVYAYRLLTSRLIQLLASGSPQGILRRLQLLFHHGYLERISTWQPGSLVYALGNKGADVLAANFGIDRGAVDWRKKNKEISNYFVYHSLMISSFRATLELASRARGELKLLNWTGEGGVRENVYVDVLIRPGQGKRERIPLVPDGFFSLEDPGDPAYQLDFFLEADRSTMTNERFLNKMRAYWCYWKEIKNGRRKGPEAFRVLTITKSEARKENLRRITRAADDYKSGSVMFWFASEENYRPDDPEMILKPIWQTPRDDARHHLLE
jgi:Replication-relaxation